MKVMLVYQGGIANVFRVESFSLGPEGRGATRLVQGDFRQCAAFARGMAAAGCTVKTASCNMAGEIQDRQWTDDLDEQPFSEQFVVLERATSPRVEVWYSWRELRAVDGEEEPRLLIPWSNPDDYEFPMDLIFATPEEARAAKLQHAPHEDWFLCRVTTEVVERVAAESD